MVGFAIDCKYCLGFFVKGFAGIFPNLVLVKGSACFSNLLLSLRDFRMNCSVCCTTLSCRSFPELSRSQSLTLILASWTWDTLSGCICRVSSMDLDSSWISRGTVDIPLSSQPVAKGDSRLPSWIGVVEPANHSSSSANDTSDRIRRLSI